MKECVKRKEPLSYAGLSEAFAIFAKYDTRPSRGCLGAEHDAIYAGEDTAEMTSEDRERLEALGWFISEEFDCWTRFV